jgi:hypothetical protein
MCLLINRMLRLERMLKYPGFNVTVMPGYPEVDVTRVPKELEKK